MEWSLLFFLNSILFGVGLAMDAFSVSVANAINEPDMKAGRMSVIAGTFAFFQIAMPLIGWLCIHTIAETFTSFQKFIPWIAFFLLLYIGGKMILEAVKGEESEESEEETAVGIGGLIIQGIATSIDALSVGFAIAEYQLIYALTESLIIGIVTFIICIFGLKIGKIVGNKFADKAGILGGVILLLIGIEILLKGIL